MQPNEPQHVPIPSPTSQGLLKKSNKEDDNVEQEDIKWGDDLPTLELDPILMEEALHDGLEQLAISPSFEQDAEIRMVSSRVYSPLHDLAPIKEEDHGDPPTCIKHTTTESPSETSSDITSYQDPFLLYNGSKLQDNTHFTCESNKLQACPILTSLPDPRNVHAFNLYYGEQFSTLKSMLEGALSPTEKLKFETLLLTPRTIYPDDLWIRSIADLLADSPAILINLLQMIGWAGPDPVPIPAVPLSHNSTSSSPQHTYSHTHSLDNSRHSATSKVASPICLPEVIVTDTSETERLIYSPTCGVVSENVLNAPPTRQSPTMNEVTNGSNLSANRVHIRADANGNVAVEFSDSNLKEPQLDTSIEYQSSTPASPLISRRPRSLSSVEPLVSRCSDTDASVFSPHRLIENYATLQRARSLARSRERTVSAVHKNPESSIDVEHWKESNNLNWEKNRISLHPNSGSTVLFQGIHSPQLDFPVTPWSSVNDCAEKYTETS
jgi:hypothetical protein